MIRRIGFLTVVSAVMLSPSITLADGECAKGYRDTTPAERATMVAALEAARGAFPAAPEGWILENDGPPHPIETLCRDYEDAPWSYGLTRSYQRVTGFETRDRLLEEAAAVSRQEMEARQPQADEFQARATELALQAGEAAQNGDWDRVEKINQEIAKLSEEFTKLLDGGQSDEALAAVEEASRDEHFSVSVEYNAVYAWHDPSAAPLSVAGAAAAYRWGEKGNGQALILIGPWKAATSDDGSSECTLRTDGKPETARSAIIQVYGDETRLESVIAGIDVATIAAALP